MENDTEAIRTFTAFKMFEVGRALRVFMRQLFLFDLLKLKPRARPKPKVKKRRRAAQPRKRRAAPKDDQYLKQMWIEIRKKWFPTRPDLDSYSISWSRRRQIRTLASCNYELKRVTVARELNHPEHACWLEPLLYHEMCHGVLGDDVGQCGSKMAWHGPRFQKLENRHPGVRALDVWIKSGGWLSAVRSDRARRAHQARREK